jgi:hypothetical protein
MDDITREKFLKIALVAFGASSSPSTRSASFGRRDGNGTVATANTTCR